MVIRIKRHFLLIAIAGFIGFLIGSWAISEYRAYEAQNLMNEIQQSKDSMNQLANGLALMQVALHDYSPFAYIITVLCAGIANGYYLVMAFHHHHGNSPLMVFLYIILLPVVGFMGTVMLIPIVIYEGYMWLIKKQAICFLLMNSDAKAKSYQICYPHYENDLQKQLIEEYLRNHTKATLVGLAFMIPIFLIGSAIYFNMKSSGLSFIIFIIFVIIAFVGGIILMMLRQTNNMNLQTTFLKTCDTQLYVDSMAIIVNRCTWDISNQNAKAEHVNAMLVNGDYDQLKSIIKKYRVPMNAPARWMAERKIAELQHQDEVVMKYGNQIRNYYHRALKRQPKLKTVIDTSLLNMDIRDDMYFERYHNALEKMETKPESESLYEQVGNHYQLGKCYYLLGQLEEAKPHLEFVEEFGNTTAFRKDIQNCLKALM